MCGDLVRGVADLKRGLVSTYTGNSPLIEAIPAEESEDLPIGAESLEALHRFAKENPIYTDSFKRDIGGHPCVVYEGDSNDHWLDSIKHDTSYAPFYTTWILSAYILAHEAALLGAHQAVDIGAGDGRIAYCCSLLGMESHGIEIDEGLVVLQEEIARRTQVIFRSRVADATQFDYCMMNLDAPCFFIGGLPEIGEILAESVISKIISDADSRIQPIFVLAGTSTAREGRYDVQWGWDKTIHTFNLEILSTITLPTRWTMDQPVGTPYIFTRYNSA